MTTRTPPPFPEDDQQDSQPVSAFVSHRRDGRTLSDTVLHLNYRADEARSALQKTIRRNLEREACWWGLQFIRHGWARYLHRTLRVIAVEDIGIASPDTLVAVDAILRHGDVGTDGLKKTMFVGMAEMAAIILLCRAPKCHTAVNALLSATKLWKQIERGEVETPPVPEFAIDAHTARGRAAKVPLSQWWKESAALSPKGKTHGDQGGDPFAQIEGDEDVLK